MLFNRLPPFCGVGWGNGRVDICGLSYNSDMGRVAVITCFQNLTLSACTIFPVFALMPGRRWT